jgi:hypothetical protein
MVLGDYVFKLVHYTEPDHYQITMQELDKKNVEKWAKDLPDYVLEQFADKKTALLLSLPRMLKNGRVLF